jgi:hypothetical protein
MLEADMGVLLGVLEEVLGTVVLAVRATCDLIVYFQ